MQRLNWQSQKSYSKSFLNQFAQNAATKCLIKYCIESIHTFYNHFIIIKKSTKIEISKTVGIHQLLGKFLRDISTN